MWIQRTTGVQIPHGTQHFCGDMCQPILTYLRMSALRTVRLLPRANVPAQRTMRTNVFGAASGDETAMRPLAKLFWTLVWHGITLTAD